MKTIIICAGLAILPCTVLADIPVGRGAISTSVTATATYDSNVFGTHDAIGDASGTLAPLLSYVRKAAQIEAEGHAQISFIRYLEQTQLNSDNLDVGALLRLPQSQFRNYSGLLSAAYVETSDVNRDINARINTKTATLVAQTALSVGPRSDLAVNANYTDTRPSIGSDQKIFASDATYNYRDFFYGNTLRLTANYDNVHTSGDNARGAPLDQNSYTFAAGLVRSFLNNVVHAGLTYGYRVLNRSASETASGIQHSGGSVFTATVDGPFLPEKYFPKITSQFSLCYQDAATPGINDTGTKELTGSLVLAWQARDTTRVSFSAHRSQRLSVNDLSVVSTSVELRFDQALRYNLTGSLVVGNDWSTFTTLARHEETAYVRAELRYHFARAWDATLSEVYNSTTSTARVSTFDRSITSLGLVYHF